jgi:thiol oxidase
VNVLFVTLASRACRLPEGSTAAPWLAGVRAFIENFFRCAECRAHFVEALNAQQAVTSADAAVLWLWEAHNGVNARLAKVRELLSWEMPPLSVCGACGCLHAAAK